MNSSSNYDPDDDLDWRIAMKTGNPVFAWRSIYNYLYLHADKVGIDRPEIRKDLTIPADMADFLLQQSFAIHELSRKIDPVVSKKPKSNKLNPKEAIKKISSSLGFSRQGYNSFEKFFSNIQLIQEYVFIQRYKESTESNKDYYSAFRKEFGPSSASESTIDERLQFGKSLLDEADLKKVGIRATRKPRG